MAVKSFDKTMSGLFGSYWDNDDVSNENVDINEVPILFTDGGKICCIPKLQDQPVIGLSGARGSGKSYCAHGIFDRMNAYWDYSLLIGNDSMMETRDWIYPNSDQDQINTLEKLNEKPIGMPLLFVAPNPGKSVIMNDCVPLSIPAKEVFATPEKYFDLGKSRPYFIAVANNLINKTREEINEYLLDDEEAKRIITSKNSRSKLAVLLNDMFNDGVINEGSGDSVSKVKVLKEGKNLGMFTALNAACVAGLIPSIQTGDILEKDHVFPFYLAYWFTQLYNNQMKVDYFKNKNMMVFVDELKDFYEEGNNSLTTIIERIVRRGRPVRMGMIYCTQFYNQIPREIRVNSTYTITFGYKNTKQIKAICSDHELPSTYESEIRKLDHHRALALTSEHFVLYDNLGNREETKEPQIGRSLPTLSQHTKPKKTGGSK